MAKIQKTKQKKVIVVGAGIGGLAAAAKLAQLGFEVKVLEKNEAAGGRISQITKSGFKFDLGPSWYMMPEVFANFWKEFSADINDYLQLIRLDPSYKAFMPEGSIDIPANMEQTIELFEKIEPGAGEKLKKYLQLSEYKYNTALQHYVYETYDNLFDFFDLRLLASSLKLDLLSSLDKHVNKFFKNKSLQKILKFMVVFIGGAPTKVPAQYSLLTHADMNLGIWYPMGGMQTLAEAFVRLGSEQGVSYLYNEEVTQIELTKDGSTKAIYTKDNSGNNPEGNYYEADIVVVNADYQHTDSKLLAPKYQNYSSSYWENSTLAPSALLFYLGINKKLKNLEHHNLMIDKNWDNHFDSIFKTPVWPEKPLYYVNVPSFTDKTVAPENMENVMILIPIASGLKDTKELRDKYYEYVISDLEKKIGEKISDNIIIKESFSINDFKDRYSAFEGNAFGLAHTLWQTAIFRPSYRNKKMPGLFYTGQFTVPGVGVPIALISGRIVAEKIASEYNE